MPERSTTVRAVGRDRAVDVARTILEAPSESGVRFYTLRVIEVREEGPWTEGPDGTRLFTVSLQGDEMTESEARSLGGDR